MKKNHLLYISILFIMCIGLLFPTNVFAKSNINFNGYVTVDYRFFVENGKNNENVKNLNFRLYDQTNAFSFQSEYNPNLENYYFIESYSIQKSFYQGNITYNYGDEKAYTMFESYDSSIMNSLNNAETFNDFQRIFNNKKISGSCSMDGSHYLCHALHTIPMVLEEINHEGEGQAIKKIVFATLEFTLDTYNYSSSSVYFTYDFYIQNNSCSMLDYYNPNSTDYSDYGFFQNILFMRETSLEYSEDLISAFAIGTFTSEEIEGEEFLNKKFSSSEIASMDNQSGTIDKLSNPRTEENNYNEQSLRDYCDCLPVFVQKRIKDNKSGNIIDTITNPNTGGGICILLVSIIIIVGVVNLYAKRKKNTNNN